jgi:hypothetical protein
MGNPDKKKSLVEKAIFFLKHKVTIETTTTSERMRYMCNHKR